MSMRACDIKRGATDPKWGCCVLLFNLDDPDKLLLFKRAEGERQEPGSWGFSGGKVDAGESASEALVREVKEETGIDLIEYDFVGGFVWDGYVDYVFVSRNWKGTITLDPKECADYAWVTLDDIHNGRVAGKPATIFSFTQIAVEFYEDKMKSKRHR